LDKPTVQEGERESVHFILAGSQKGRLGYYQ